MKEHSIDVLREKLIEELKKYGRRDGDISTPDMEAIYKLSESIKAIDTICAMDDRYENEESYKSYHGYKRDPAGRYGKESYSGRYYPMSYDDAKFNMVHKLNDLMMCTENDHTKSVLRNAIAQLEMN